VAVKTTINLKQLKKHIIKVQKEVIKKRSLAPIQIGIIRSILRGVSPVKGKGKFKRYSKSYINQIRTAALGIPKNTSPVNLKLSGQLLKSFFIKGKIKRKKGAELEIGFKDELADIHNRRGAGKSKVVRRMLPTKAGEQFTRRINTTIQKIFQRAIKKVVAEFKNRT